jgi:hypothetical protein
MKASNRAYAIRVVVGALLSHSPPDALAEVVALLKEDSRFGQDVSRVLATAVNALGDRPIAKRAEDPQYDAYASMVDLIYATVQRRRLSKQALISRMRMASDGRYRMPSDAEKMPVRKLVRSFVERTSVDGIDRLLASLGAERVTDPYLEGIVDPTRESR